MQALENRIPPPLVAVLFAVLMGLLARGLPGLDPGLGTRLLLALPLVMAGLLFVLAGGLAFRRAKTTVNPLKPASASALVTSGIYQYTRNPMYVGFALWLLAWGLYLASPLVLLGVLGFVLYMNRFQIYPEERALGQLFGADFAAYRQRVRRWL
ncbi:isoprenylcysteine carboxylmethyltransferase family protein [Pseudomonas protegens]|jgi:protein-S-isoprenylcysteine O-methyltransferase Ste14|uniref:Isoprenylcysteine carboxylmethyltransferase family protein n=3 Tax=Pseudomonas protegens TaxID=380021 RepID=A0ABY2VMX3_9PSED|nr:MULTISPECIES: isoprenylcysteine carboxylmethyltransferase family protein [Pseudomonas]AAY91672.1 putative membrane protein [Pseudomonas protegens Pf-5]AGL84229.1 putative membrane protein [Pseudomonas protegens CHA0]ASE24089.1 isoprenylcysteine carboxylmethyltransferase family protein [Pseudomonas protegens]MBP5102421.1 isoprenylcysteine carboxylmethyltransferase family protein [Pseudomonas protegens]MBP5112970.1 isoprenylcysteine carboxylmethyltransferase family protein [Pseudomonas proteg